MMAQSDVVVSCGDKGNSSTVKKTENTNSQQQRRNQIHPSPLLISQSSSDDALLQFQDLSNSNNINNNRSPLDLSNLCKLNGSENVRPHDDDDDDDDDDDGKYMKLWQCKICNKEFSHQYTLMRHLPIHTDERKFQCKICGKAFRQMSTLSQHRAIHSFARPFICEICHKTFNRISTLISHRKTHTGIKPHQCHICNKAFHQKGNLRNHIYTHTNARPYKCDECGKGYNQMSNLMCHKFRSHRDSEKPKYFCKACDQYFIKRADLRKHEQIKHEVNNLPTIKKKVKDGGSVGDDDDDDDDDDDPDDDNNQQKTLNAIFVEPIRTKAMQLAIESNQIPFALLKPLNGMAVLVRVLPAASGDKQMLIPASAEDLKKYGTISVTPNIVETTVNEEKCSNIQNINGSTVKIKIPVVATVIQENTDNGQLTLSVISPGPQDSNNSNDTMITSSIERAMLDNPFNGCDDTRKCVVEDGAVVISKNENLNAVEMTNDN